MERQKLRAPLSAAALANVNATPRGAANDDDAIVDDDMNDDDEDEDEDEDDDDDDGSKSRARAALATVSSAALRRGVSALSSNAHLDERERDDECLFNAINDQQ